MAGDKKDNYLRVYRDVLEDILTGKLDFYEFGMLMFISLLANPYDGIVLTNFSDLANKVRLKPDKIRYLSEKLKGKKRIWYELKQGQREFTKLYINGFPLANGTYIDIGNIAHKPDSEVEASISKSKDSLTIDIPNGLTNKIQGLPEVPNKEKDKNNNIKHYTLMKSYFLELSERYKNDKILIKEHFLKDGYTESQIEESFRKWALNT